MSNLVERLLNIEGQPEYDSGISDLCSEAAAEIERLRAQLAASQELCTKYEAAVERSYAPPLSDEATCHWPKCDCCMSTKSDVTSAYRGKSDE